MEVGEEFYRVELFDRDGWLRKKCPSCGRYFWTLDADREICGEPPCSEYTFINDPPTKRSYNFYEIQEEFLSFFEENGHTRINRYPVVARWREDIFLTIASIACFQPWVLSGEADPPANPLVIAQPSIRLNDIDNVGRTGRHFTLFTMGGHHAFNTQERWIYFKDETVELCHNFLKRLGIPEKEIVYIESWWEGGGNAGPCFETIVRGAELATLVFMMYEGEEGNYREMEMKVVDTGYGIERFAWISQGTPTAYDAVFPEYLSYLRDLLDLEVDEKLVAESSKLAGLMDITSRRDLRELRSRVAERVGIRPEDLERIMKPLENAYAIADHTRCIVFMLGDGVVPSNVREGYLARLVIRRTLRLMRELDLDESLEELVARHLDLLLKYYREFEEVRDTILDMVRVEERRYSETLSRGRRLIERIAKRKKILDEEDLIFLYDSHGIPPEIVERYSRELGIEARVPDDFYSRVAERHQRVRKIEEEEDETLKVLREAARSLPRTKDLFYEDQYLRECDARVLKKIGNWVALDQTVFYAEGGGQPSDTGYINGVRVRRAIRIGGVIFHELEDSSSIEEGEIVRCVIDWDRRLSLMRHHTGTHIINAAAREVLGKHVWQAGAQKDVDRSRLDITHYKRITEDELERIEKLANEIVARDLPVRTYWMKREEAERKYGFRIYQGGVAPGRVIRIVDIEGFDAEACGGTHCSRTGEVGFIKIIRTERIQDGVERIEFAVSLPAVEYVRKLERTLKDIAKILNSPIEHLVGNVEKLVEESREQRKEIEKLKTELSKLRVLELLDRAERIGELKLVILEEETPVKDLIRIGEALSSRDSSSVFAGFSISKDRVAFAILVGEEARRMGVSAANLAMKIARILGGGSGGDEKLAQGGGSRVEKIEEAKRILREELSSLGYSR